MRVISAYLLVSLPQRYASNCGVDVLLADVLEAAPALRAEAWQPCRRHFRRCSILIMHLHDPQAVLGGNSSPSKDDITSILSSGECQEAECSAH